MDTAHETRPPGGPPPPGSRPPLGGLTRATDDTVISGLCGGLGRHFGVDPLVFRIAFVVMSLAGGTGILLYLVGWALVPDDQGQSFGARWLPGKDKARSHKLLAAAMAGIGVLLLMDEIFDGHGDDFPLGLVLVGVGAAVLWSRRDGRAIPPGSVPPPVPPPPTGGWTEPAPVAASAPPTPSAPSAEEDAPTGDTASSADPTATDLTTPPPAGSSASWADTAVTRPIPPPSPSPPPVYAARAPKPPKPPKPTKPRSALVAVTLSLLAILAGVVTLAGLDLVVGLALALFLVAGAMIVGAWRGRARGLIPIAILLSGALLVASVIDVPLKGGAGERLFRPTTVAELRSPYRLAAGELALDLRGFDADGRTVPVVATMAVGNVIVTVPEGMAVEVDAHVGAGTLLIFGREWSGVGIDERMERAGAAGGGRLELDVKVGLGDLEVRRAAA
ncbi:MAG: hypothetical protein QOG82_2184 [Actinomycetota bacterium]|nr:hypothetical protein [Actinomycetota bacterium]